jgi:hypothetical protein
MHRILAILIAAAAPGALADGAEPGAPAPTNAPAADAASTNEVPGLSLPGADLWTEALRSAHDEYRTAKMSLTVGRTEQLRALLDRYRQEAEASYDEKRRFGNIKGMMIAKTLVDFVKQAQESLAQTGDFEFPGYIRHELRETFEAIRREKEKADSDLAPRLGPLQDTFYARFKAEIAGQMGASAPADETLRPLFMTWLGTEPPALPPPPPEPEPGATPEPNAPPPAAALPPGVIAQNADAEQWETFARWTARMSAPAAIFLPIIDQIEDQTGETQDVFSGKKSEWKLEIVKPMPGSMKYVFRLKKIDDRTPVELGHWPTKENRGQLLIRAPLHEAYPADFGFELQGAVVSSVQTRAGTEPSGTVDVAVKTQPPGARIFVGGTLFREAGEPVKTPCTIRLPPGETDIRLSLPEHVDKEFPAFAAKTGAAIEWTFQPEKDLPGKTVPAQSRKIWASTGITVKRGDRIWILPSGQWTVGARNDNCGPDGYPNTPQYAHYYKDPKAAPRQVPEAPYGALLAKVGYLPSAKIVVVGAGRTFQVGSGGELLLDANETAEESFRRDNRGSLDVKVIVIPSAPPAK